jgi:hypothetical protein
MQASPQDVMVQLAALTSLAPLTLRNTMMQVGDCNFHGGLETQALLFDCGKHAAGRDGVKCKMHSEYSKPQACCCVHKCLSLFALSKTACTL